MADDDGLGPIALTGRWVGFYRHLSEQAGTFPIIADILQEGRRISGEMYDQITDRSETLEKLLDDFRDDISPGWKRRLEQKFDRFGPEAVIVNSRLPATSGIEGKIAGDAITFVKTYRGPYEIHCTAGGRDVSSAVLQGHEVRYSGHLDRERRCIVGRWVIWRRVLLGRFRPPGARGTFELYWKS